MPKISLLLADDNPYFLALMGLPPRERKAIVRQVTFLCMATDLDPEGALEVLARVGVWLNERPAQTAEYHTLRLAGLQLFQKLQK